MPPLAGTLPVKVLPVKTPPLGPPPPAEPSVPVQAFPTEPPSLPVKMPLPVKQWPQVQTPVLLTPTPKDAPLPVKQWLPTPTPPPAQPPPAATALAGQSWPRDAMTGLPVKPWVGAPKAKTTQVRLG